jgi:hypothetical protein
LHYSGNAFDYRSKHIEEEKIQPILSALREALGENFDAIYEGGASPHYHVEYDPKGNDR